MFHYDTCCVRWCTLCINQRYKEAFQKNLHHPEAGARLKQSQTIDHQNWQAIIKLAAYWNRRSRRCGYAFEAITLGGINLFTGATSSGRRSTLHTEKEHNLSHRYKNEILKKKEVVIFIIKIDTLIKIFIGNGGVYYCVRVYYIHIFGHCLQQKSTRFLKPNSCISNIPSIFC